MSSINQIGLLFFKIIEFLSVPILRSIQWSFNGFILIDWNWSWVFSLRFFIIIVALIVFVKSTQITFFILHKRCTLECTDSTRRTGTHYEFWLSRMFETCSIISSSCMGHIIEGIEVVINRGFLINFPITVSSPLLRDIFLYFLSRNLDFILSYRLFFILRESFFFLVNFLSVIFVFTVGTETLLFFGWTHFSYYFNLTNFSF